MFNEKDVTAANLPKRLQEKIKESIYAGREIIRLAATKYPNVFVDEENISIEFINNANEPMFNVDEKAQIIFFATKYENLSDFKNLTINRVDDNCFIDEKPLRDLLNEYRPIYFNYEDPIYYERIHKFFIARMLFNEDATKATQIRVASERGEDITRNILLTMKDRIKCIKYIIEKSDFNYVFNGVLQHSDKRYLERYSEDYESGEITFILLKNVTLLMLLKCLLYSHYRIIRNLTYISKGGLY